MIKHFKTTTTEHEILKYGALLSLVPCVTALMQAHGPLDTPSQPSGFSAPGASLPHGIKSACCKQRATEMQPKMVCNGFCLAHKSPLLLRAKK